MHEATQIAVLLLELFIAFGIMLIGFGYMFAGKAGGGRVAQFYFGGSLRWTLRHVRALLVGVLTSLWAAFVFALTGIGRVIRWLVRRVRPRQRPRDGKPAVSQRRSFWQAASRLLADINRVRRRYIGMHSMAFLLFLLCVVVSIFLICVLLLLGR